MTVTHHIAQCTFEDGRTVDFFFTYFQGLKNFAEVAHEQARQWAVESREPSTLKYRTMPISSLHLVA